MKLQRLNEIREELREIRNKLRPMIHANQTDTDECRRLFDAMDILIKERNVLCPDEEAYNAIMGWE